MPSRTSRWCPSRRSHSTWRPSKRRRRNPTRRHRHTTSVCSTTTTAAAEVARAAATTTKEIPRCSRLRRCTARRSRMPPRLNRLYIRSMHPPPRGARQQRKLCPATVTKRRSQAGKPRTPARPLPGRVNNRQRTYLTRTASDKQAMEVAPNRVFRSAPPDPPCSGFPPYAPPPTSTHTSSFLHELSYDNVPDTTSPLPPGADYC